MTDTSRSQAAEVALHELLDHLQKWMMAQPQLLLLWTQDRGTRRRVAELVAKELLTIPVKGFDENTPPNRALRRRIIAELRRANDEWWKDAESFIGGV